MKVKREKMRRIAGIKVKDVMTKKVVTVSKDTSIKELKKLFEKYDYNAFPVVEEGKLVGIVSKLDFLKVFRPGFSPTIADLSKLFAERVEDIMRRYVFALAPEDSLTNVIDVMVENRVRTVPVVKDGKVVGVIAHKDVIKHTFVEK